MTSGPFGHILVGYLPTEQGADARALGVDLALVCDADLLLVSVVSGLWIEQAGQPIGPPLVHSGGRDRAASALKEAAAQLAGTPGIGQVERRLEVSSSAARGVRAPRGAGAADHGRARRGPPAPGAGRSERARHRSRGRRWWSKGRAPSSVRDRPSDRDPRLRRRERRSAARRLARLWSHTAGAGRQRFEHGSPTRSMPGARHAAPRREHRLTQR